MNKVIQIATYPAADGRSLLYALTEDGTIWYEDNQQSWHRVKGPGERNKRKVTRKN